MLKTYRYDAVTRIDMARTLAGRGHYWTTAYLVDGVLVDTGCAHTARELAGALVGESLALIVNTHSHEDHIGANGTLQQQREGLGILAHPLALCLSWPGPESCSHCTRIVECSGAGPNLARVDPFRMGS